MKYILGNELNKSWKLDRLPKEIGCTNLTYRISTEIDIPNGPTVEMDINKQIVGALSETEFVKELKMEHKETIDDKDDLIRQLYLKIEKMKKYEDYYCMQMNLAHGKDTYSIE